MRRQAGWRRHLALVATATVLSLAVAAFLPAPSPGSVPRTTARGLGAPLAGIEAISAAVPRIDLLELRLGPVTPRTTSSG